MEGDEKYWEKQLFLWQSSGDNGASWCRKHNIAYHIFCYWKWKFRDRQKEAFKEKNFIELSNREENETGIEVEYLGAIVRLSRDFDSKIFKRLFLVLQDLQC